ncbi:sensor histidine kinase [Halalkalibacillus halophilus]|uniref:sensor histidine kinase n=1 Tax=Halalkalibacillus halophilus TaxID=392827 RepID=UPI00040F51B3|nr:ATP-binding protein [Halalkalibacillus halophilus]
MKLRNKIFAYSTLLFITVISLLAIIIYITFSQITYDREVDRLESEAESIMETIIEANDSTSVDQLLRAVVPSSGMVRIIDENGETIRTVAAGEQSQLREIGIPTFETGQSVQLSQQGIELAVIQRPVIWVDGSVVQVQVVENLQAVDDNLNTLQLVLFIVVFISLIPIIISGKILSDLIVRPIKSFIQTMEESRQQNTFKHIPLQKKSNDEMYTLGKTYNELMDLLKDNYDKQEAFVSNASHELRTPITIIESYANLIKRRGLERPEVIEEAVEAIHSESLRMKDLTEQLLLLAKRDQDWNLQIENISLTMVVQEISKNIENAYNRKINVAYEENVEVVSDEKKLKQLLYIFFDNACKYSEKEIDVYLNSVNQPQLTIIDYGIGIPEDAQKKIFDRFYRVDEARNRESGGVGLGLSLAQEIAEALHVEIKIDSQEGIGTKVTLTFEIGE